MPTRAVEIPAGPIRGYFAPWVVRHEEDPELARFYELSYQRHRRKGNIRRLGLSVPMVDMFRSLFISFAMFTLTCAVILALAYVSRQIPFVTQRPALMELFRVEILILFTVNVALLLWSITRNLIRTVKEI